MILKGLSILKHIPLEDLTIEKSFIKNQYFNYFGYGAQGDRFLINQTTSNGILYSLSSSGILGTLFLLFSLLSLRILLKNFLNSLHLGLIVSYYSSIVVFVILLRSILEVHMQF